MRAERPQVSQQQRAVESFCVAGFGSNEFFIQKTSSLAQLPCAAKLPCGIAQVTAPVISRSLAAPSRAGPRGRWPCRAQFPAGDSIEPFWLAEARPRPR